MSAKTVEAPKTSSKFRQIGFFICAVLSGCLTIALARPIFTFMWHIVMDRVTNSIEGHNPFAFLIMGMFGIFGGVGAVGVLFAFLVVSSRLLWLGEIPSKEWRRHEHTMVHPGRLRRSLIPGGSAMSRVVRSRAASLRDVIPWADVDCPACLYRVGTRFTAIYEGKPGDQRVWGYRCGWCNHVISYEEPTS